MFARPLAALTLALTLGAAPHRDALPKLGPDVSIGRLAEGGTYIVRPIAGPPLAAVELWFRAPSIGYDATPVPSLARLAAQSVAASTPVSGSPLGTLVHDAGGRLTISAYADSISVQALVPSQRAAEVTAAMTRAYFSPVVDQAGLDSARTELTEEALFSSFDPVQVARSVLFADLFAAGPDHYPALGEAKQLAKIELTTVRDYAARAFRAQNAVLVASGGVDAAIVDSAVAGRADPAGRADDPVASAVALAPAAINHNFDQRGGGSAWIGPPITDERSATALDFIADYLFRQGTGQVTAAVDKADSNAVVDGQFITLHDPGVFFVAYSAKDAVGVGKRIDEAIRTMQTPLASADFARARTDFEYHLLSDLQTAGEVADNFGWYAVEGNLPYAPGADGLKGAYFNAAQSLTPEFVAAVAAKYLGAAPARITFIPPAAKPAKAAKS
ncbi:MAG: M16 family metallopeptidase [Vulcanimicrobiaceae bacterium]